MTPRNTQAQARLKAMLAQAENAPSLPAVALEVLRISQDEDASMDDLARVIALDPALAARMMRFANSAIYNPGSEVNTLQRAAMLLGLKTVQLMALSFSLTDRIPKAGLGNFNYNRFWRRSSIRAVAARSFAQGAGSIMPDEAFLCGLILEFGQIVMAECCDDEFDRVLQASPEGLPLRELEREWLGFDHGDTLMALLQEWNFPQSICATLEAALNQISFEKTSEPIKYTSSNVLSLACLATDILTLESVKVSIHELESQAQQQLGLQPAVILEILNSLEQGVRELDQMLGLGAPEGRAISEILESARERRRNLTQGLTVRASVGQIIHDEMKAGTDLEEELRGADAFDYYLCRSVEMRLEGASSFPIGLLYLDVTNLDELPADYSAATLRSVLSELVRASDLWARIDKGQYAIIMNESSPIGLRRLAERLSYVLCNLEKQDAEQGEPSTRLSMGGVSMGPILDPEDAEHLKQAARRLAQRAKASPDTACLVHPKQLQSIHQPRQAG